MIIGQNTIARVSLAINHWLQSQTTEIDKAYQEAGNELNVSISIKFGTDKYGKHKRKVKGKFATGHITFEDDDDVNEAQQSLPGME